MYICMCVCMYVYTHTCSYMTFSWRVIRVCIHRFSAVNNDVIKPSQPGTAGLGEVWMYACIEIRMYICMHAIEIRMHRLSLPFLLYRFERPFMSGVCSSNGSRCVFALVHVTNQTAAVALSHKFMSQMKRLPLFPFSNVCVTDQTAAVARLPAKFACGNTASSLTNQRRRGTGCVLSVYALTCMYVHSLHANAFSE